MYHPTRGGVRGGRDQFSWDEVKADKHRENYLGHSVKAPVGRWQKGKDLNWYARDKKQGGSNTDAMKEEIQRVKEQEEQAMREALGLAPKSSTRPQGNRLDKQEYTELIKRGSTAEDLGAGKADAVWVHGIGYAKTPRPWEDPSTLAPPSQTEEAGPARLPANTPAIKTVEDVPNDTERNQEKDKHEERKPAKRDREERHERREKHEKREKRERHEKRHSRDSDDKKKHKKEKKDRKRRHDSDSD
ncbi:hypothetical protein F2Q69_00061553 [Brassica cretica]|uniref:Multiple myeloma tumor-associated protein 2-like N-terminal domain-containing protein n=1 Tax=Brassica cretica TaxID=69181 RepID=A0A8S9RRM5_BRACR|nr:hypothetical protein F2Q69_00061553 [Brassica cretica]